MSNKSALYGRWGIKEAHTVGSQFKVICVNNHSYRGSLTVGKEYLITITKEILPTSPLCSFINDNGHRHEAHLTRFSRVEP